MYGRPLFLAGIPVRDDLILELARLVDDDALATRLEDCYGRDVKLMVLDIPERETIIRALEDPPPGLEELRGVPVAEHVSRHGASRSPSPFRPSHGEHTRHSLRMCLAPPTAVRAPTLFPVRCSELALSKRQMRRTAP